MAETPRFEAFSLDGPAPETPETPAPETASVAPAETPATENVAEEVPVADAQTNWQESTRADKQTTNFFHDEDSPVDSLSMQVNLKGVTGDLAQQKVTVSSMPASDTGEVVLMKITKDGSDIATFHLDSTKENVEITFEPEYIQEHQNLESLLPAPKQDGDAKNFTYKIDRLKLSSSLNIEDIQIQGANPDFALMFSALGCQARDKDGNHVVVRNEDTPFDILIDTQFLERALADEKKPAKDRTFMFERTTKSTDDVFALQTHLARNMANSDEKKRLEVVSIKLPQDDPRVELLSIPVRDKDDKDKISYLSFKKEKNQTKLLINGKYQTISNVAFEANQNLQNLQVVFGMGNGTVVSGGEVDTQTVLAFNQNFERELSNAEKSGVVSHRKQHFLIQDDGRTKQVSNDEETDNKKGFYVYPINERHTQQSPDFQNVAQINRTITDQPKQNTDTVEPPPPPPPLPPEKVKLPSKPSWKKYKPEKPDDKTRNVLVGAMFFTGLLMTIVPFFSILFAISSVALLLQQTQPWHVIGRATNFVSNVLKQRKWRRKVNEITKTNQFRRKNIKTAFDEQIDILKEEKKRNKQALKDAKQKREDITSKTETERVKPAKDAMDSAFKAWEEANKVTLDKEAEMVAAKDNLDGLKNFQQRLQEENKTAMEMGKKIKAKWERGEKLSDEENQFVADFAKKYSEIAGQANELGIDLSKLPEISTQDSLRLIEEAVSPEISQTTTEINQTKFQIADLEKKPSLNEKEKAQLDELKTRQQALEEKRDRFQKDFDEFKDLEEKSKSGSLSEEDQEKLKKLRKKHGNGLFGSFLSSYSSMDSLGTTVEEKVDEVQQEVNKETDAYNALKKVSDNARTEYDNAKDVYASVKKDAKAEEKSLDKEVSKARAEKRHTSSELHNARVNRFDTVNQELSNRLFRGEFENVTLPEEKASQNPAPENSATAENSAAPSTPAPSSPANPTNETDKAKKNNKDNTKGK